MTTQNNPNIQNKGIHIWLIVSQILSLILVLIAIPLITSLLGMLGNKEIESTDMIYGWGIFAICMLFYPILPVGCAIGAWLAYARQKNKLATVLTTLPLLPELILLGPVLTYIILSGALSVLLP